MIKLDSVHKYYNKGRDNEIHVLRDVTLTLPERGMVAIFGKSGCGKTTLLNVIGGLDSFADGSVTVAGEDIKRSSDDVRNKNIGYIFQNYNLNKDETCFDNVAAALYLCGINDSDVIKERVLAALKCVGMDKYAKRKPDTLSGGQQQRIAIARAIVKNPKIILADEPTGNLDEANTVIVMDLLKAISREHLVLIVTHEQNLVDYYCDKVIELSDGSIVSVRENESADGFSAKDKNAIYLGELEHSTLSDENTRIDYYGEKQDEPIRLRVVNKGGVIYVEVGADKVRLIDGGGEIKLCDGVYEEKSVKKEADSVMDMSLLPPISGERFGRLFTLRSSIKSGFESTFRNKKRGGKALRRSLMLLASVTVIMSAVFGTSIKSLINVRASYNHNVFYAHTELHSEKGEEVSERLNKALNDPSSGIDYITVKQGNATDETVSFSVNNFETFTPPYFSDSYTTNAAFLGASVAEELDIIAGERNFLDGEGILISKKCADELLKSSPLGHITEYSDLIGLVSNYGVKVGGKNLCVTGVVDSDESAMYLSDIAMVRCSYKTAHYTYAYLDSEYDREVKDGETTLVIHSSGNESEYPSLGDTVKIRGKELRVTELVKYYSPANIEKWYFDNGRARLTKEEFFDKLAKERFPDTEYGSEEFDGKKKALLDAEYFSYYDYYYEELGEFLDACYVCAVFPSFDLWLYAKKGIDEAKYSFVTREYADAVEYKRENGRYPTLTEYEDFNSDEIFELYSDVKYSSYMDEYSSMTVDRTSPCSYLVSENDYIELSRRVGETHATAKSGLNPLLYTVIHSYDVEATEKWLERELSHLDTGENKLVTSPADLFAKNYSEFSDTISANLIAMLVILLVMCVCMYFIVRASFLGRIKEIGIYRAIGVSKRNILFRFTVEGLVLAVFTVLIGYLITSAFLGVCLAVSPLISEILYYPLWLAIAVLCTLTGLSVVCGILPVLTLVTKTPSAIIAKYDI